MARLKIILPKKEKDVWCLDQITEGEPLDPILVDKCFDRMRKEMKEYIKKDDAKQSYIIENYVLT